MEHVRKVRLSEKQRLYLVNNLRWDAVLLLADEMKVPKEQIKDAIKRNPNNAYDAVIVKRLAQISGLKGFI